MSRYFCLSVFVVIFFAVLPCYGANATRLSKKPEASKYEHLYGSLREEVSGLQKKLKRKNFQIAQLQAQINENEKKIQDAGIASKAEYVDKLNAMESDINDLKRCFTTLHTAFGYNFSMIKRDGEKIGLSFRDLGARLYVLEQRTDKLEEVSSSDQQSIKRPCYGRISPISGSCDVQAFVYGLNSPGSKNDLALAFDE